MIQLISVEEDAVSNGLSHVERGMDAGFHNVSSTPTGK